MSEDEPEQGYVYCTECGETFPYMDLLVDHHADEHETFDRAIAATVCADQEGDE